MIIGVRGIGPVRPAQITRRIKPPSTHDRVAGIRSIRIIVPPLVGRRRLVKRTQGHLARLIRFGHVGPPRRDEGDARKNNQSYYQPTKTNHSLSPRTYYVEQLFKSEGRVHAIHREKTKRRPINLKPKKKKKKEGDSPPTNPTPFYFDIRNQRASRFSGHPDCTDRRRAS